MTALRSFIVNLFHASIIYNACELLAKKQEQQQQKLLTSTKINVIMISRSLRYINLNLYCFSLAINFKKLPHSVVKKKKDKRI